MLLGAELDEMQTGGCALAGGDCPIADDADDESALLVDKG